MGDLYRPGDIVGEEKEPIDWVRGWLENPETGAWRANERGEWWIRAGYVRYRPRSYRDRTGFASFDFETNDDIPSVLCISDGGSAGTGQSESDTTIVREDDEGDPTTPTPNGGLFVEANAGHGSQGAATATGAFYSERTWLGDDFPDLDNWDPNQLILTGDAAVDDLVILSDSFVVYNHVPFMEGHVSGAAHYPNAWRAEFDGTEIFSYAGGDDHEPQGWWNPPFGGFYRAEAVAPIARTLFPDLTLPAPLTAGEADGLVVLAEHATACELTANPGEPGGDNPNFAQHISVTWWVAVTLARRIRVVLTRLPTYAGTAEIRIGPVRPDVPARPPERTHAARRYRDAHR